VNRTAVLVVARTEDARNTFGSWLEEEGFEVMACPGPSAPDYTCVGSRGGKCPLAESADVIVLDLELAGDVTMRGTPGWELFLNYVQLDKRIVAIVGIEEPVIPAPDDQVAVVRRPPNRRELTIAIRTVRPKSAAPIKR
jgi:CheY-like chemotaxis protein